MSAPDLSMLPPPASAPMPPPGDLPTEAPPKAKKKATPARWVYRVLITVFTIASIMVTVVPFMIPRSGHQLVLITSGSMTPLYPMGGTIVIDPTANKDTLQPGQIITFKSLSGTTITHRIIARVQNDNLEGVWYQTKGDANNAPDPDLASASAIVGLSLGELPWWQDLAVQGQTPKGRLVVFGGLFLLVALGEGSDLVRAVRRKSEES
jgi:signal peptidase